jgi:hypothetical protein
VDLVAGAARLLVLVAAVIMNAGSLFPLWVPLKPLLLARVAQQRQLMEMALLEAIQPLAHSSLLTGVAAELVIPIMELVEAAVASLVPVLLLWVRVLRQMAVDHMDWLLLLAVVAATQPFNCLVPVVAVVLSKTKTMALTGFSMAAAAEMVTEIMPVETLFGAVVVVEAAEVALLVLHHLAAMAAQVRAAMLLLPQPPVAAVVLALAAIPALVALAKSSSQFSRLNRGLT